MRPGPVLRHFPQLLRRVELTESDAPLRDFQDDFPSTSPPARLNWLCVLNMSFRRFASEMRCLMASLLRLSLVGVCCCVTGGEIQAAGGHRPITGVVGVFGSQSTLIGNRAGGGFHPGGSSIMAPSSLGTLGPSRMSSSAGMGGTFSQPGMTPPSGMINTPGIGGVPSSTGLGSRQSAANQPRRSAPPNMGSAGMGMSGMSGMGGVPGMSGMSGMAGTSGMGSMGANQQRRSSKNHQLKAQSRPSNTGKTGSASSNRGSSRGAMRKSSGGRPGGGH